MFACVVYSLVTPEPGAVCVAFLCVCGGMLSALRYVGLCVARPLLYASGGAWAGGAFVIGWQAGQVATSPRVSAAVPSGIYQEAPTRAITPFRTENFKKGVDKIPISEYNGVKRK